MVRVLYFSAIAGLLLASAITAADLPERRSSPYDPAGLGWAFMR